MGKMTMAAMEHKASGQRGEGGQQLSPGGRYVLQRVVATDGAATVHEAIDTDTGERVGVNRWPVHPELSADGRERMAATALQAKGLQHPGIVELHDFGWDGDSAYAVTAFVQGETLAQFLDRSRPLPALQGLSLSLQLLAALAAAHERGLVHSALNPQHVLMGRDGQLKIAGFGWVAAAASAARRPGVFDVPAYMAPEQILGRPADCRADLYSAAVLAYELFTGSWPYQAHTAPRPARALRRELPTGLDAVFERAQARNPEARHRNAAELAAALQAAFGDPAEERAVVPVRPEPVVRAPAHVAPGPARRRRTGAALVAGVAAAVLLGGLFMGQGVESTRPPMAALDQGAAPAPAPAPVVASPAPPAAVDAAPATVAIEAPKSAQPRESPKPVRATAAAPAPAAQPRPRTAMERRVDPGPRETVVARQIEAPPREAAPAPPPPAVSAPRDTVERPARQRTAATEPPQRGERSSRATAAMAAPPSPSPVNVCRQESSMARDLCLALQCASPRYREHPVCVRMFEQAAARNKPNMHDGM